MTILHKLQLQSKKGLRLNEKSDGIDEEETFNDMKNYFEETEEWLYEEGENASENSYNEMLNSLHGKLNTFEQWETKLRKSKVMKEEKKRYREQKLHKSPRNTDLISKQIPVTDDDEELYPRRMHREHTKNRPHHKDCCQNHNSPKDNVHSRPASGFTRGNNRRSQMFDNPF